MGGIAAGLYILVGQIRVLKEALGLVLDWWTLDDSGQQGGDKARVTELLGERLS